MQGCEKVTSNVIIDEGYFCSPCSSSILLCVLHNTGCCCYDLMANLSTSFLAVENEETCLLCKKSFSKSSDTVRSFSQKGWPKIVDHARKWKDVNLPVTHDYYMFTHVHEEIKDKSTAFGRAHEKCRVTFSTKCETFRVRFAKDTGDEKEITHVDDEKKPGAIPANRRSTNSLVSGVCFVCTTETKTDKKQYKKGGLAKLSGAEKDTVKRLHSRTESYITNHSHPHYPAACRFAQAFDLINKNVLDSDIYYHQKCYIRYVL